jgi:hypothetical protein
MRATNVVVFSSLLIATAAIAGPDPKTPAKTPAKDAPKDAPKDASKDAPPPTPTGNTPVQQIDPATVKPEDMPTSVRQRRLEQGTQALKERAWQLKARVQMLKEQMLGGGVGAQAVISHTADMGSAFRLIKLTYSLDGTAVFVRTDETAENLYKAKSFDIFTGPISPGNHNLAAVAIYRGHGYGVFEYLSKYTFTAKGGSVFTAGEGKIAKVECRGFEKGGPTVPLEKRAAIDCKVTQVMPEKAATPATTTQPGTTPLPASTPAPNTTPAPNPSPGK